MPGTIAKQIMKIYVTELNTNLIKDVFLRSICFDYI
jgi:hypothetical protein